MFKPNNVLCNKLNSYPEFIRIINNKIEFIRHSKLLDKLIELAL